MSQGWDFREHLRLAIFLMKWLLLGLPLGAVVGSAVAFFLWSLDHVIRLQWQYSWLLYLLPLAGLLSGWIYHSWGQAAEGGNNLIMDQIHEPGGGVPRRMAPLVLFGTLLTHLFGGSAGREGTAVQMGGSIASALARFLNLGSNDTRIVLMCGVASGFGAVFGTPLTGAIFALEVLTIGRMSYQALVPCLIASVIGDQVVLAWGIEHTHYPISSLGGLGSGKAAPLDVGLAGKVALAAVAFGMVSVLFAQLTHAITALFKRAISQQWLRPAVGGALVIALTLIVGSRDYLGLGVSGNPANLQAVSIETCFIAGGAWVLSWWWKLLFTALTVGSGFKGGEVTPLFFVGAALGHVLGIALGAPVDLMAGLGFVAVFAGATKTPLACTLMAVELFAPTNASLLSSGFVPYAAIACFLSYLVSGHSSIYRAQRLAEADARQPKV